MKKSCCSEKLIEEGLDHKKFLEIATQTIILAIKLF